MKVRIIYITVLLLATVAGCSPSVPGITEELGTKPPIFPDYDGVTVPVNIAPLNFNYLGEGKCVIATAEGGGTKEVIHLKDGLLDFGQRKWKRLIGAGRGGQMQITLAFRNERDGWSSYQPITINVSEDPIEPYVSYRLVPPGYQSWREMGIYQRNLENYRQSAIYENHLTDGNCINCHSYPDRNPSKMVFHSRAVFPGTVLIDGDSVEKIKTGKGTALPPLVYPYWHPSGKFIAFSSNVTRQNFFSHNPNRIEVYDTESDVLVYDIQGHRAVKSPLTSSKDAFETFPTFTPDGSRLLFCSAEAVDNLPEDYDRVKYSIVSVDFDWERCTIGDTADTLVNARTSGSSASFPRISPDGKFLVYTRHAYGNFSIWHRDADLWLLDLQDGESHPLTEANSDDVESYHSWSGNSRWLAFSSRRIDGLYTRIWFTHISPDGEASKAFLLPQKNPLKYYNELMVSYNIPELMSAPSNVNKRNIADALKAHH